MSSLQILLLGIPVALSHMATNVLDVSQCKCDPELSSELIIFNINDIASSYLSPLSLQIIDCDKPTIHCT